MDRDIRKLAISQYIKNFIVWFIIILILGVTAVYTNFIRKDVANNPVCPAERVYDEADVLTDTEEDALRKLIAQREEEYHLHIVIYTTLWDVPYGGEHAVRAAADDFYDECAYGYNKPHGDGVVFLDCITEPIENSYHYVSTSGRAESRISVDDIDYDIIEHYLQGRDSGYYQAYANFVEALCDEYKGIGLTFYLVISLIVGLIVGLIYMAVHKSQKKAENTTNSRTYMDGQEPEMLHRTDNFIRKSTTSVRIQSSSGGGSGSGHHVSSGGHSHGGGGRRG